MKLGARLRGFSDQELIEGVFELAKIMGTSVRMIEKHYGALIDGAHAGDHRAAGRARGRARGRR